MADSRPPAGEPEPIWPRRASAEGLSDSTLWLRRWRERLPEDDTLLPENEARLVVEAVLEDLGGGRPDNLDRAGRAWGRAHRSVSEMVGRLSSFREALAANGVSDPLRMHRAVDRVTAAATEEVLHRLEHASRTDALTGVGNRRSFDETLTASLSAASRQGHEVTVVAVDLDGLKRINDSEGHSAGDAALLALVRSFYVALRDEDTVFRVGGDEFVILLPFTSVGAAELLMERIQASGAPKFTWGAAGYPGDATDASALVDAADHDLYRRREARRGGRPVPQRRMSSVMPLRAEESSTALRWAWIPAAAVLLVTLVATLVSTTSGGPKPTAQAKHHQSGPVTSPGSSATPNVPSGTSSSGASTSSTGGTGASTPTLLAASFMPTSGSSGTSPGSGGGGGSSGGGGSPPSQPPSTNGSGGLLGTVSNLVAPLPLVGGSNGLVAVVNQLLTGSPTTAGTRSSTSTSANSSGLSGVVAHLLG